MELTWFLQFDNPVGAEPAEFEVSEWATSGTSGKFDNRVPLLRDSVGICLGGSQRSSAIAVIVARLSVVVTAVLVETAAVSGGHDWHRAEPGEGTPR
jgi:hypothetical protein